VLLLVPGCFAISKQSGVSGISGKHVKCLKIALGCVDHAERSEKQP
jgi:hypothetical protein